MRTSLTIAITAACLAACAKNDRAKVARRTLPGFSLELPSGAVETAQLDYAAGELRLDQVGGGPGSVVVHWSFGTPLNIDAALMAGRATARSDALELAHVESLEHGSVITIAIDSKHSKLQSYVQCGERSLSIATDSIGTPLHNTILGSLHCEPDPAREKAGTEIPVAIDLTGFVAYKHRHGALELMRGAATVTLQRQLSTSLTIADLERDSASLFQVLRLDARAQPRRGNVLPFTATYRGTTKFGLLRQFDCFGSTILIIATVRDEASIQDVEQRVGAARCLAPGESRPTWPDQLPPT